MSDNILILHPRDALYRPENPARVLGCLEDDGFVRDGVASQGEHPSAERRTFRTGSAFDKFVLFGESSRRPAGFVRDVCQVVVVGPLEQEWFLASGYTDDPKCPSCGENADWNAIASEWYERPEPRVVTCSACGARAAPWDFDWQGTAGFARWYIEVWHVHRDEAQPSAALMDGLARATGTPWSWIYYRL